MKILRAIGGFFVKIWRWIKNTAWVQPLLIVGIIFGVIFSIPSITNGIKNLIDSGNSAETYFKGFKKSLEGEKDSSAEKLLANYAKYQDEYEKNHDGQKLLEEIPDNEEKYFLFFVNASSINDDIKDGFSTAANAWKDTFGINDTFRLYTIFTDEETTTTTSKKSAFSSFMDRESWFFEKAASNAKNTNYYENGHITDDQLQKLSDCDPNNFQTPMLVLVDWTILADKTIADPNVGVTQLAFSITGDESWARAKMIADCWQGTGDFAKK